MKSSLWMLTATLLAGCLVGCSFGDIPKGSNAEETKKALSEQSPEKQIQYWQTSPAPASEKAAKIKEIEEKYHITAQDLQKSPGAAAGTTPTKQ
ncbi:MAG TPA: hypothetical protein VKT78_08290 [Fimbriimonadaceae bacterium]|nr:hypothetical protein [Fimbriimonadaceae bacterium]